MKKRRILFSFAITAICVCILLLMRGNNKVHVKESNNNIFTSAFFENIDSIELIESDKTDNVVLTKRAQMQQLVDVLTSLILVDCKEEFSELTAKNGSRGIAFYLKDGTEKRIWFTSELISDDADAAKAYALEEGNFEKIMDVFGK